MDSNNREILGYAVRVEKEKNLEYELNTSSIDKDNTIIYYLGRDRVRLLKPTERPEVLFGNRKLALGAFNKLKHLKEEYVSYSVVPIYKINEPKVTLSRVNSQNNVSTVEELDRQLTGCIDNKKSKTRGKKIHQDTETQIPRLGVKRKRIKKKVTIDVT